MALCGEVQTDSPQNMHRRNTRANTLSKEMEFPLNYNRIPMSPYSSVDYPRGLVGCGRNPPDSRWPSGARTTVQRVVEDEEGDERGIDIAQHWHREDRVPTAGVAGIACR
jgi:hypothetical protein